MKTYNVKKSYDSRPSKNGYELKNVSLEEARMELDGTMRILKYSGHSLNRVSQDELIIEEGNGSEITTLTIEENE